MHGSINEMLSTCILCAGTTLFWKGHRYGYMCIYMYLFVTEDFKEIDDQNNWIFVDFYSQEI